MFHKEEDDKPNLFKVIIVLFNLVALILCIIWTFKIINNAKSESTPYDRFISNDTLQNYTESDFCYGRKYEYSKYGAFKVFNIRMDKIKKFARAILATKFVSIGNVVLVYIVFLCCKSQNTRIGFVLLYVLIYLTNCILNVIFIEKLSNYYSESNFYDFERFSKCDYLKGTFRKSYEYMNNVKKNCFRIFVINFISAIFEAINIS